MSYGLAKLGPALGDLARPLHGSESRARIDALRAIARDIPDPAEYASHLPDWAVEALLSATKDHADGWCAPAATAAALRPLGLVGYGTRGLTAFGWAVRQALKRTDA